MSEQTVWTGAFNAAISGLLAHGVPGEQPWCYPEDAHKLAGAVADDALKAYRAKFPDSPASEPEWTGHARVELMGHRSYLGRIREVDRYGARLGEVQELLASGEYGDLHQFGGKSVYEIRPLSLEAALRELRPGKGIYCGECGIRIRTALWGDANYEKAADETCERCKAKGEGRSEGEQQEAADIPFDASNDCGACAHAAKSDMADPCNRCRWATGEETDPIQWMPGADTSDTSVVHPEQDEA